MGKDSRIEWTNHTFNPWWGCDKVSPACAHCYAEAWAKRVGQGVWGKTAPRRLFGTKHWEQPLSWNTRAQRDGRRARVFCASMADVFEEREDLDAERQRLWVLIDQTPWLDWLLLTKRPHAVAEMVPWTENWPDNVWLGTTVENFHWAKKRIPHLVASNAKRKFLSCEPLLGPVDLKLLLQNGRIDWVIAGGESGGGARATHPDWFRSLRDRCQEMGVCFHFKQWGNWVPVSDQLQESSGQVKIIGRSTHAAGMRRVSKKAAGRILDGREWNEVPQSVG